MSKRPHLPDSQIFLLPGYPDFLSPLDLFQVGGLGATKISRLQDVAYTPLRESSNPS